MLRGERTFLLRIQLAYAALTQSRTGLVLLLLLGPRCPKSEHKHARWPAAIPCFPACPSIPIPPPRVSLCPQTPTRGSLGEVLTTSPTRALLPPSSRGPPGPLGVGDRASGALEC